MTVATCKSINLALLLLGTFWACPAQSFCFSFSTEHRNSGFSGWRDPAARFQPPPWQGWQSTPVMPGMSGRVLQPVPPLQWNDLRSRQFPPMRY